MLVIYLLALLGALMLCHVLIESLWSPMEFISSYLMPYFLPAEVESLPKRFGSWAAVTGGTDGIGKQYAAELARRGFNIVIISRNPEKLQAVAAELERTHGVKTKVVVADFSRGAEVYPHIEEELRDLPLGVLVNNVGSQLEYPMPLCDIPWSKAWELINVNVAAVTMMSRMVLPGMVQRGRGALVNVSSASELQPIAQLSIYAATKSYVRNFTLAIRDEYSSKGIFVQHLCPFFVATKMNSFSQRLLDGNLLVPDAAGYARQAVATLGRVHSTTGYWTHGMQCFFVNLAPMWLKRITSAHIFGDFRQEYLNMAKAKTN